MHNGEPRWTIAELSERVSAALAEVAYEPPANGQVRAVPDLRTIRYYTSIGLLDRASAMKGRTALYGRRHLLQLVAVKRLQAEGRSLNEVQAALTGLDDARLAAIARVPPSTEPAAELVPQGEPRRAAPFWAATPAAVRRGPAVETERGAAAMTTERGAAAMTMVAKIDLAPGVSLFIDCADRPGANRTHAASIDRIELARAAAPLLEVLRRHGFAREAIEKEETE
jgi:DNA-binding transcriptional MerR regulator